MLHSLIDSLSGLEWIGILIARVAVGTLFALSGLGKLFIPAKKQKMQETVREAHLPAVELTSTLLSSVELIFGSLLIVGFLTPLACVVLIGQMLGALVMTVLPGIKADSAIDWLEEFFYLPEVLYIVILIWMFFSGPGRLSLDDMMM